MLTSLRYARAHCLPLPVTGTYADVSGRYVLALVAASRWSR
ncbi:hypothetical protein [Streptomyces zagrosensis]|uniref:Uncharacterized protein n=1 Tax=Streptomyces zagrosensis TaxID=1042984 RepID=A0A7W9UYD4_9ACTN|nr:hypothetical protein [Streptomyces zagrosensis]MBB5935835.1 hypothetical protein [Streptomyces zagrosensis]